MVLIVIFQHTGHLKRVSFTFSPCLIKRKRKKGIPKTGSLLLGICVKSLFARIFFLSMSNIIQVLYKDYPESLHTKAAQGIVLHLHKLELENKIICDTGADNTEPDTVWNVHT